MIAWEKLRPAALRLVPGALLGVIAGTLAAYMLGLDVTRVNVPESIAAAVTLPDAAAFAKWLDPSILAGRGGHRPRGRALPHGARPGERGGGGG